MNSIPCLPAGLFALALGFCVTPDAAAAAIPSPLAGTWELVAADLQHPDGTRSRDYGSAPKGRLLIDGAGRYSLQIFKAERPRFIADNKQKGSADEFAAAVLGSSTHFGTVSVEGTTLTFAIEGASFPNWEDTRQRRQFELEGDMLSYRVPARDDGNIPLSVWRRVH